MVFRMNTNIGTKYAIFTDMYISAYRNKGIRSNSYTVFDHQFFAKFTNHPCTLNDTVSAERHVVAKFNAPAGKCVDISTITNRYTSATGNLFLALNLDMFPDKYSFSLMLAHKVLPYKESPDQLSCFGKA